MIKCYNLRKQQGYATREVQGSTAVWGLGGTMTGDTKDGEALGSSGALYEAYEQEQSLRSR